MTLSARRLARQLRRLIRQPFWFVLFAALFVGIVAGTFAARETGEVAVSVFGKAWQKSAADSRTFLMTLLGLQLTVLSIVISFNAPMIQSAANQYSPRLVPYYLKNVPLRRVSPVFGLSGGYILAAVREVGLATDVAVRPRIVISGAVILAVAAFVLLTAAIVRTYRLMRVERILGLVRVATIAAIERRAARVRRLRLVPSAPSKVAHDATPVTARTSGYLVEVDVRGLARIARRAGVRVRISRAVGDYLDEGEVVGWARRDGKGSVSPRLARRLAGTLVTAPTREPDYDPAWGSASWRTWPRARCLRRRMIPTPRGRRCIRFARCCATWRARRWATTTSRTATTAYARP